MCAICARCVLSVRYAYVEVTFGSNVTPYTDVTPYTNLTLDTDATLDTDVRMRSLVAILCLHTGHCIALHDADVESW